MLDLHSHVLPGIDDGPRSMEGSMALLRAMVEQGVQHVVATPHIYPGVFDNTAESIRETFDAVLAEVTRADLPLTMSWGAEVRLCSEMLEWLDQGRLPFLGRHADGGHTVLLELPDGQIPVGAHALIGRLRSRDLQVLIAHPERNRAICANPELLWPLMDTGARLQLTAASLIGEFGRRAEAVSRTLLDHHPDWIAVVASDAHSVRTRPPRLGSAREWLIEHYGLERAEELTERNPARWAGIGQIVFQGRDGTTLRDLDVAPMAAAARASASPSWLLSDLPTSPTAGGSTPALPLEAPGQLSTPPDSDTSWMAGLGDLPQFACPSTNAGVNTLQLLDDGFAAAGAEPMLNVGAPMDRVAAPLSSNPWSLDTLFGDTQPAALFIPPETGPLDTPASSPEGEKGETTIQPPADAQAQDPEALVAQDCAPADVVAAEQGRADSAEAEGDRVDTVIEQLHAATSHLQVNGLAWPQSAPPADTWREPKLRLAYQRSNTAPKPLPPTLNDVVEAHDTFVDTCPEPHDEPGAQIIELNFAAAGSPEAPAPLSAKAAEEAPVATVPVAAEAVERADATEIASAPLAAAPSAARKPWWKSLAQGWGRKEEKALAPKVSVIEEESTTAADAEPEPQAAGKISETDGATAVVAVTTTELQVLRKRPAAGSAKPMSSAALGLDMASISREPALEHALTDARSPDLKGISRAARSQPVSPKRSEPRGMSLSDISLLDKSR